jgi:hypothetical protein
VDRGASGGAVGRGVPRDGDGEPETVAGRNRRHWFRRFFCSLAAFFCMWGLQIPHIEWLQFSLELNNGGITNSATNPNNARLIVLYSLISLNIYLRKLLIVTWFSHSKVLIILFFKRKT